jgi:enhancing lycopene biosynthesis protein 2
MKKLKKVAVLLSGCGVYDGSEIIEASSILMSIHKYNLQFQCFSLNQNQMHVINHAKGEVDGSSKRNMLEESSRISRGNIKELKELDFSDYSALIIPGGFGVAKNFCNFATEGEKMTVNEEIREIITKFHSHQKPIGACCISPILIAKVLDKVTLTLGKCGEDFPYSDSIKVAESWGAVMEEKDCGEICVDEKNKIITTPAFMKETKNWNEIYEGMDKMVNSLKILM